MAETIGSIQLTLDPNSLLLSHCSNNIPLNPNKPFELITDSYFMERGSRYDAYAQLRESKLQSKKLNFEEDEQVLEIPKSEFSPLKKCISFQDNFATEKVSEIPRFSPMKKSVSFQGDSKKQGYSEEQVSEIPRYSEFSPMKTSVRFQGNGKIQGIADEKISEIPRYSEFSPMKKNVRFQGNSKKQGYSVLAQSVPDFSSVIRKENQKPSENRIPRFEKSATPPPSVPKREKMYGSGSKLGGMGSKSVNSGEKQSGGKLMMMGRKSYASIDELKGLSIAASNAINGEIKGAKKGGNVLRKSTVFSTRYY